MSGRAYTCARCGGTFEPSDGWTDEDAAAEAAEVWGDDLGDDVAVVCDDCYQRMIAAMPPAVFRAQMHDQP